MSRLANQDRAIDDLRGLGANERAILERIPSRLGRRMAAGLVRLKMRLQFTGWLQYLLPLPIVAGLLFIAGVGWLVGAAWLMWPSLGVAGLLASIVAVDIVTTKLGIRLPERRPPRLDDVGALALFRARRSCRSFQTRPMSDADREELLAAVGAQLAVPTIGATVPRLEYVAAPVTVWPTVNASEFLVAIVPKPYDRTAIIDVGRTLHRVVMHATRMGLGTCWIGPGADHRSLVAHLGDRFDATAEHIVCVCAVGYRSRYLPLFIRLFNFKMSNSRLDDSELFFADRALEHPVDLDASPLARFAPALEACRWAPSSYNGQTTRAAVEVADGVGVTAVHFMAVTASRYYAPVALGIWCASWELGCEALGETGAFECIAGGAGELPRHDVTWRSGAA